jgi:hypothetical protein
VPKWRVGHRPGARVRLDLAAGDRAQQVDVVDGHVEQVGMPHPGEPASCGDLGGAQVAPARDADPEEAAERALADELLERP